MVARTHPATGLVVTLTRVGGEESPPSPIAGRVFVNLCAALLSPGNESGGRHDQALGDRGANGSRDARGRRTEAGRRPALQFATKPGAWQRPLPDAEIACGKVSSCCPPESARVSSFR